jgi:hypothetical protein
MMHLLSFCVFSVLGKCASTPAKCGYQVLGRWSEKLWKHYKLSHDKYEEHRELKKQNARVARSAYKHQKEQIQNIKGYLHLCRDGVVGRKLHLMFVSVC